MSTFGQRVKAAREGKGWSQKKLAQRAGISRNYLSQIERGKAMHPSWDVVRRLVNALGLPNPEGAEWRLYVWNYGHAYAAIARSVEEAERLLMERYGGVEKNMPYILSIDPAIIALPPVVFCVTFGAWDLISLNAAEKAENLPRDHKRGGYRQARGVIPWDGESGADAIRRLRGAIGNTPVEVGVLEAMASEEEAEDG